jgi:hypothetical protein
MSVWTDSGGLAVTKATTNKVSDGGRRVDMWLVTLGTLQVIHVLHSILLFAQESLLVVVFSRSADTVEENTSAIGPAEEVDESHDEGDKGGRAKGRQHADKDAFARRTQCHGVYVYLVRIPGDGAVVRADGPWLAVDHDGACRSGL